MILDCDIGNTRCKWRVLKGSEIVGQGSFLNSAGFTSLLELSGIERVRVSCVADAAVKREFEDALLGKQLSPEYAATSREVDGVVNAYQNFSVLGVDRWSAIVAAYHYVANTVLIIDAGSALTVDLVEGKGRHLGGYIIPGFSLMKTSLLSDTGGVRFDEAVSVKGLAFGCSTVDAVNAGVLSAQIGAIMLAIQEAERLAASGFPIILTGGDAGVVREHLANQTSAEMELLPNLVLDGLQRLLP